MSTKHVVVVGAGIIGLATAWHLQERGVAVTVVDSRGVAAGSSWGNAGWLTPALTLPLGEPSLLTSGPWQLIKPTSPLHVPVDIRLVPFLAGFAWHALPRQWKKSIEIFAKVNPLAMDAFHELTAGGVSAPVHPAEPFLAGFKTDKDRELLLHEFDVVRNSGGDVDFDLVTGDELRGLEPALGEGIGSGVLLHGQWFINPPEYLASLADAVRARGGEIRTGFTVTDIDDTSGAAKVISDAGDVVEGDSAVLATGAWLNRLARKFGVRAIVQAGRGYSFSVKPEVIPTHPIYFPKERLACTPLGDRLRIGGMMEFKPIDSPRNDRRIQLLVDTAKPVFQGIDWDDRDEEWVGGRPVTPDGHALIGRTRSERVFVGGGHGMWGIALGPLTGRMLAGAILGDDDPLLHHFDPLR